MPHKYGSLIPHPDYYDNKRPPTTDYLHSEGESGYDSRPPKRPHFIAEDNGYPNYYYGRPPRPISSDSLGYGSDTGKPLPQDNIGGYTYDRPTKPLLLPSKGDINNKPSSGGGYGEQYDGSKGSGPIHKPVPSKGDKGYNKEKGSGNSVVTHSIGSHGEHITSIITELKDGKYDVTNLGGQHFHFSRFYVDDIVLHKLFT